VAPERSHTWSTGKVHHLIQKHGGRARSTFSNGAENAEPTLGFESAEASSEAASAVIDATGAGTAMNAAILDTAEGHCLGAVSLNDAAADECVICGKRRDRTSDGRKGTGCWTGPLVTLDCSHTVCRHCLTLFREHCPDAAWSCSSCRLGVARAKMLSTAEASWSIRFSEAVVDVVRAKRTAAHGGAQFDTAEVTRFQETAASLLVGMLAQKGDDTRVWRALGAAGGSRHHLLPIPRLRIVADDGQTPVQCYLKVLHPHCSAL